MTLTVTDSTGLSDEIETTVFVVEDITANHTVDTSIFQYTI